MPRRELETSWTRFLADEPLSSGEEEQLLRELATSPVFRGEALRDAWLDTALRQRATHASSREAFVSVVKARLGTDLPAPLQFTEMTFVLAEPRQPGIASARHTSMKEPALTPFMFEMSRHSALYQPWSWKSFVACALAVAAILVLGSAILLLSNGDRRQALRPSLPTAPRLADSVPPMSPKTGGFAHLAEALNCVWDTPRAVGDRLDKGSMRLLRGTAKIAFDGGPVVELNGPATLELIDDKRATLRQGKFRTEPVAQPAAQTTAQPTGFTLDTPTARVVDQGAACELFVAEDGATDVCVHRGEVDLEQCTLDRSVADRWRIGLGGSKRVDAVGKDPISLPQAGAFKGVLSINGQTREFTDRADYEKARKDSMEQLEKFRKSILGGLGEVSDPAKPAAPAQGAGGFKGQLNVNGQQTDFDGPEAFEKARRQIQEQLEQFQRNFPMLPGAPSKPGNQAGGFKGQININGQSLDFDNPKTFMEMQRRMMEQLQQLRRNTQPMPPTKR